MYYIGLLIGFFVLLLVICLLVYFLVVRAFYWGDKDDAPDKRKR